MIIANMQVTTLNPWPPRLAAFVLALLVGASVVFWALRWPARETGRALPLPAGNAEVPAASAPVLARLLGAGSTPAESVAAPDAASRFHLIGIVGLGSGQGVAVLSIDGKAPRPYRVGSVLEEGLMLQSVEPKRVALASAARAPVLFRLDLPARQP
jgi:general secretion pathway protein C